MRETVSGRHLLCNPAPAAPTRSHGRVGDFDYCVTSSWGDHNICHGFHGQINHRDFDFLSAAAVQLETQIMFPPLITEITVAGPYPKLGPLLPRVPSDRAIRSLVCSSCFERQSKQ